MKRRNKIDNQFLEWQQKVTHSNENGMKRGHAKKYKAKKSFLHAISPNCILLCAQL